MLNRVFLDSAYAIALSAPNDQHHAQAVLLAERLEAEGAQLITTRAVVLEIGNALSKQRYRQDAIKLLHALEADPNVEIVPVTEGLYQRGFQLYSARTDKDWGITDCISFIVMEEQGLKEALTTDAHFQQAGFHTLLRES